MSRLWPSSATSRSRARWTPWWNWPSRRFGRIDILNHVAGVFGAVDFMQSTEADYDKQMNINAKGTYLVDQAVLRIMIPNRAGKIVNMCSQGKYGFHTNIAYTASKFAVAGMTQSIAQYAAPYNINVNCVCPGVVRTNIWERALDDIRRQGGDAGRISSPACGISP